MILSDFGIIVNKEWIKSFEIRKELFLDEYIIMPNHIHAIVRIENDDEMFVDETTTVSSLSPTATEINIIIYWWF